MNFNLKTTFIIASFFCTSLSHAFELKSADLKPNGKIPPEFVFNGMGCTGENLSPELHWTGAPKDTKSFAITVYDPDAPTGSGFWHWIAYGFSPSTTSLKKGWRPIAGDGITQAATDYGAPGYNGPCPPPGKPHHYIFTVYALKTDKIEVPAGAPNAIARFMIMGNVISKASFTALYGK